jgi:hypothetical protein
MSRTKGKTMDWINNEQMTQEQAERIGRLKIELKGLTKSAAETVRIAVIGAIHAMGGDIDAGLAQVWSALREAYNLRQYKGSKDNPLTEAEKNATATYNTFYKALERTVGQFQSIHYGDVEVVQALTWDRIAIDVEYNGKLDMSVALVNFEQEMKRRKALAEKRIESIREKNDREAAARRGEERRAEIEQAVKEALAKAKAKK